MGKQLYIIKGTGLNLDGSVVVVTKREGDYCVVSPPNSKLNIQTTMVHKHCLQSFASNQKFTYTIIVEKNSRGMNGERRVFEIKNAIRDVSIDTIVEYLNTNLTPILRME